MSLRGTLPIAFIDTETSSLDPGDDERLIEIALVRWLPSTFISLESMIRADDVAYAWEAMAAHHVRPLQTKRFPGRPEILADVRAFLNQFGIHHLVAHNARFDRKWLPELHDFVWLDSLKLARRAWPTVRSHKNFALFHGLNLDQRYTAGRPSHRALTDVLATSEVFFAALEQLGLGRDATIDDIVRTHDAPFEPPVLWYGWKEIRGLPLRRVYDKGLQWVLDRVDDIDDDTRLAIIRILAERRSVGIPAHLAS